MSYANRLKKLQGAWKAAKPAVGGGSLPAGKYQMEIKRAIISEGKAAFNKGHMQVELTLVVLTGKLKGRKQMKWIDLEAPAKAELNIPDGMAIFKGIIETLGMDMPQDLGKIEEFLKQLIGCVVNTQVVVNQKGYAHVYINSLVNAASESAETDDDEAEDEAEAEDDDDDDEDDDADSDDDAEDDDEDDESEDEEKPAKPAGKPLNFNKPAAKPASGKKPKPEKEDEDFDDWQDSEDE